MLLRLVRPIVVSFLVALVGTGGLAAQDRDCTDELVDCLEFAKGRADAASERIDQRNQALQAAQAARSADHTACRDAARSFSLGGDPNRIASPGCESFRDELRALCDRRVAPERKGFSGEGLLRFVVYVGDRRVQQTSPVLREGVLLGWFDCMDVADELHRQRSTEIQEQYKDVTGMTYQSVAAQHAQDKLDCRGAFRICEVGPPVPGEPAPPADSGGSGGAGRREEPCPPGTEPSPLGLCTRTLRPDGPLVETLAPGDRCPPGMTPGPDDRCRPMLATIGVRRLDDGDGYWVICPQGTRPSPVDGGCVLDERAGAGDPPPSERGWQCPPGTVPGPDAGCVPDLPNGLGLRFEGRFPRLNGLRVDNPERALAVTERAVREGFERGWERVPDPR